MSEEEAFCSHCGAAVAPPAKQPDNLQQLITALIGFPVLASGLLLTALGGWYSQTIEPTEFGLYEYAGPLICIALGAGMALLGSLFVLATFLPSSTARRVLVGVGAAVMGFVFFALVPGTGGALSLPAAAGVFYLAYRIAR